MQRVTGEQQPAARAPELLLAQAPHRQHHGPGHSQSARRTQPQRQPRPGDDRRERGEQGVEDAGPQRLPELPEVLPRGTVPGSEHVQARGGLLHVTAEDRAAPVPQGVGEHLRGVAPSQPLPLQFQSGQDGGSRGQGIEGAEQITGEVGVDPTIVPARSSGLVLRLQDLHAPARVGQEIGRHQPVGSGSDDYGVRHGSLPPRWHPGNRCPLRPRLSAAVRSPWPRCSLARTAGRAGAGPRGDALAEPAPEGRCGGGPQTAERVFVEDDQGVLAPRAQFHRDPRGTQRPAVRLQFQSLEGLAAAYDRPVVQGDRSELDLVAQRSPQLGPRALVGLGAGGADDPVPVLRDVGEDRPHVLRRLPDQPVSYGHGGTSAARRDGPRCGFPR